MKNSTKVKLQKALIVAGSLLGIGGAVLAAYTAGHDKGREEGYRDGYTNGLGENGDQHKFNEGVTAGAVAHHCFLYDPATYNDYAKVVSDRIAVSHSALSHDVLPEKVRDKYREKFGPDMKVRVIVVGKPPKYDECLHADAVEKIEKPEPVEVAEEPEDIPTAANELGEEVG